MGMLVVLSMTIPSITHISCNNVSARKFKVEMIANFALLRAPKNAIISLKGGLPLLLNFGKDLHACACPIEQISMDMHTHAYIWMIHSPKKGNDNPA